MTLAYPNTPPQAMEAPQVMEGSKFQDLIIPIISCLFLIFWSPMTWKDNLICNDLYHHNYNRWYHKVKLSFCCLNYECFIVMMFRWLNWITLSYFFIQKMSDNIWKGEIIGWKIIESDNECWIWFQKSGSKCKNDIFINNCNSRWFKMKHSILDIRNPSIHNLVFMFLHI